MATAPLVGVEGTHGTIAGAFTSLPGSFTAKPGGTNWTPEENRNGQDINFAGTQGVDWTEWSIDDSPVYSDSIGPILQSALGAPSAGVHKLADDPKSLSFKWTQRLIAVQGFQALYCVVDKLSIKFEAGTGELTYSASGIGLAMTKIAVPTQTFDPQRPMASWRGVVSLNGSTIDTLAGGQIDINRNRKPFHTIANTRSMKKPSIGSRTVSYNLDLEFASAGSFDDYVNATTGAFDITWTDGADSFGVNIPKGIYKTHEVDDSGDVPLAKVTGVGLYDTTALTAISVTIA